MMPARPLRPDPIFEALVGHGVDFVLIGGLASTIHGSTHVTFDVDIVPRSGEENLTRLSEALTELEARVRHPEVPEGLPFGHDATSLASAVSWNLTTPYGDLDISFAPSGTEGFDDLVREAEPSDVFTVQIQVASLADIVRSKSAADRTKDRLVLPELRELLDRAERGDRPARGA